MWSCLAQPTKTSLLLKQFAKLAAKFRGKTFCLTYLETIEGVPVLLLVATCNSLRESKVCELGNFSPDFSAAVMTLETCVFVTTILLTPSETPEPFPIVPAAPPLA